MTSGWNSKPNGYARVPIETLVAYVPIESSTQASSITSLRYYFVMVILTEVLPEVIVGYNNKSKWIRQREIIFPRFSRLHILPVNICEWRSLVPLMGLVLVPFFGPDPDQKWKLRLSAAFDFITVGLVRLLRNRVLGLLLHLSVLLWFLSVPFWRFLDFFPHGKNVFIKNASYWRKLSWLFSQETSWPFDTKRLLGDFRAEQYCKPTVRSSFMIIDPLFTARHIQACSKRVGWPLIPTPESWPSAVLQREPLDRKPAKKYLPSPPRYSHTDGLFHGTPPRSSGLQDTRPTCCA